MPPLNAEELAILESVESGEWQSVQDIAREINRYQGYARTQVNALESVSVELSVNDLEVLRKVAQKSGISVSLLAATVLHQFAASHQEIADNP